MSEGAIAAMEEQFRALGHAGSKDFAGLETFPNPGVRQVVMSSDEFTAVCPVTGQPDLYEVNIIYKTDPNYGACIESKSLKLYLGQFRNQGMFVEALAVRIAEDVYEALFNYVRAHGGPFMDEDDVEVEITQRRRGGIQIIARTFEVE